ncbi:hypothetical protein BAY59_24310 [Prauserella coralliicola]|nr:hypothetical protein BAY59_24310 [Prauserella coralliicola]
MALGDPYATLPELKSYLGDIGDTIDDEKLTSALESVSEEIEDHTNRQFNDAGASSARLYRPRNGGKVKVDDFHTADGLVVEVDADGDGVYETVWAATDYQLEPLNGVVDGRDGWPFEQIRAVGSRTFPLTRRASVRVTARWGWETVPDPVRQACLILAAETFKLKDAPFGVAGFGDYGPVRVRNNPIAAKKLGPYIRYRVAVV